MVKLFFRLMENVLYMVLYGTKKGPATVSKDRRTLFGATQNPFSKRMVFQGFFIKENGSI